MRIEKSQERTTEILDLIRDNFSKEVRQGIHLTDCLTPRRAYWQKIKPLPPSDSDIQYWTAGRGHEDAMHRITGLVHIPSRLWQGIYYSVDFYHDHVIEMKTRRAWLAKEGEEERVYDHYLAQLKGYCAVEKCPIGELWVWSLVEKTDEYKTEPKYVAYMVEFTDQELTEERHRLIDTKEELEDALRCQDWAFLPQCPVWMCAKSKSEMLTPPYCETCKREFKTDWGVDKHSESKTGAGHLTRRATYKTTQAPVCRWFGDCNPIL